MFIQFSFSSCDSSFRFSLFFLGTTVQLGCAIERLCFMESASECFVLYILSVWQGYENALKNMHYRHILLYCFKKVKWVVETQWKMCNVYWNDVITECVFQQWCTKFCSGDFNINSSTARAIAVNPSLTVQEITTALFPIEVNHLP